MQGIDNTKYAQWVTTIGRSLRINPPILSTPEFIFVPWFLYWELYTRPWLLSRFYQKSAWMQGLVMYDNVQVAGKLVEIVGRDMMKIPIMNISEKQNVDQLVLFTSNRKFGVGGGGISPGTNS